VRKRGARRPSSISRVTANRLKEAAGTRNVQKNLVGEPTRDESLAKLALCVDVCVEQIGIARHMPSG